MLNVKSLNTPIKGSKFQEDWRWEVGGKPKYIYNHTHKKTPKNLIVTWIS